jgi:fibronectin-binding autotransporter adhesin
MKPKLINRFASGTAIVVCLSNMALAANLLKQNNSDNLNLNSSWVGGTAQPGPGDIAVWDSTVTSNQTLLLGADLSWGGINMTDSGGDITINSGNSLTIGASGITSAANKWVTINTPIVLGANQTWNTPNNLNISNAISGAFSLTKNGVGNLVFGNTAHTFSGGATLNAGTVTIGSGTSASAGNLGAVGSTITLAGGTITNGTGGSNGSIALNNNIVVNSDSTINMGNRITLGNTTTARTITGSSKLTLNLQTTISRDDIYSNMTGYSGTFSFTGSGTARLFIVAGHFGAGFTNSTVELLGSASLQPQTNSGGNSINVGKLTGTSATASLAGGSAGSPNYSVGGLGGDSAFAGGIRGNSALTKVGSGVLSLTNSTILDYTGATNVDAGTLKINGVKSGTGATTVKTGTTLAGTGSLAGTTTVQSGGSVAPGDVLTDGGIGNLTFSNLTLASGSKLNVQFGSGNDKVTVASGGTLTLAIGATVDINNFSTDGTYTLFDVTGATVSGNPATALSLVNSNPNKIYTFLNTGNAIQLSISSDDPNNFWKIDGGGSWNTADNWTKNQVPNSVGAVARIGPGVGGEGGFFNDFFLTLSLDGNKTVGSLTIDDSNETEFTINSGSGGGLLFDNGDATSSLTVVNGIHQIDAPVEIDAQDISVDVATDASLALGGVVSGSGATLTKGSGGNLSLSGDNSYDGGTQLVAGTLSINSATSLGNVNGALNFAGGTLRLNAPLTGITRSYRTLGANSAIIDTNGNDFAYNGVISPLNTGNGGLIKSGAGTLALSAVQSYSGTTQINGGVLNLGIGSAVSGTAANVSINTGSRLIVDGGALTASAASSIGSGSLGLLVSNGSAAFNGGLNAQSNSSSGFQILVTGGTFNASFLSMGRGSLQYNAEPAAGANNAGLYVNGGTASLTGSLSVGYNSTNVNSSVSARIDSGSLTVGGTTLIGLNNGGRWSVLDINGGTFTSTDSTTGVQVGNNTAGSGLFLVRGSGTATVERILLQQISTSTSSSRVRLNGGTLYIGSGGIVTNANSGNSTLDVQLNSGLLGAKASWSSEAPVNFNGGAVTIKAANALGEAFDITLSGTVTGTAGFTKTGAGTLTLSGTNSYAGNTVVSEGTLVLSGVNGSTGNRIVSGSLLLSENSKLSFAPKANGEVTQITGTGAATFDGDFEFNLSEADVTDKNSWTVVDVATKTFSSTFGITGFTADPDGITHHYENGDNRWKFREDTGVLSLTIGVPLPTYGGWALTNVGGAAANVDTDLDGVSNGVEYFMNTSPGFTANPGLNANRTITWTNGGNIPASAYGTQYQVQTSSDLVNWTNVPVGELATNTDGPAGSLSYTLTGTGKRFVRLRVSPN